MTCGPAAAAAGIFARAVTVPPESESADARAQRQLPAAVSMRVARVAAARTRGTALRGTAMTHDAVKQEPDAMR